MASIYRRSNPEVQLPQQGLIKQGSSKRHSGGRILANSVSGLLFDMGDVLHDATVWRCWLVRLLRRFDLYVDYDNFFQAWDRDFLRDVHRGRRPWSEAFREFMGLTGLRKPQIDEIELACRARRRQLEREAGPLPGVRATIGRLQENGLVLGVLSDSQCTGAELEGRLQRFGLGEFFTTVVSSRDLGQTKPAPACYMRAVREMGISVGQVAFVGHDTVELAGAKAVGMRTMAFNFDADASADVYIARFEELIQEVGKPTGLAAAG